MGTPKRFRAMAYEYVKMPEGRAKKVLEQAMVLENQPLAVKIAKRFKAQWSIDTPFEDLMQAALIGVFRAIQKYNPEEGPGRASFSTLAGNWILSELQRCAHKEGYRVKSRVPAAVYISIRRFQTQHGRMPLPEEIGIDEKTMRLALEPIPYEDGLEKLAGSHDTADTIDQDSNFSGTGDQEGMTAEQLAILSELEAMVPERLYETWECVFRHGMTLKEAAKDQKKKTPQIQLEVDELRRILSS